MVHVDCVTAVVHGAGPTRCIGHVAMMDKASATLGPQYYDMVCMSHFADCILIDFNTVILLDWFLPPALFTAQLCTAIRVVLP